MLNISHQLYHIPSQSDTRQDEVTMPPNAFSRDHVQLFQSALMFSYPLSTKLHFPSSYLDPNSVLSTDIIL